MSTSLASPLPGRVSRWRALLRIARRDARRHLGRSVLVAVLVGLPVLLLSGLSVVVRSAIPEPAEVAAQLLPAAGQALLEVRTPGTPVIQSVDGQNWDWGDTAGTGSQGATVARYQDAADPRLAARVAALVPAGDRLVQEVARSAPPGGLRSGDRAIEASLHEVSDAAALRGALDVVSGRAPQARTEVLVSRWLARSENIHVGDQLTLRYAGRSGPDTFQVVGLADGAGLVRDARVIGLPGALLPPRGSDTWPYSDLTVTWQALGPAPLSWDTVLGLNQLGVTALSRVVVADPPPPERVPYERNGSWGVALQEALFVAVTVGLMLLQVALLAGPAVAVGARRNQHTLALLAAIGADRRHLRAVVLASAAVVGLVGCTVAAAAGTALGRLGLVALERWADTPFPGFHVHLLDLCALVAVGALTALAAALLPARQAARLDVIAALTGRRGTPPPHVAVPLAGLVLAVAGGVAAVIGSVHRSAGFVLLGVAVSGAGLLLMSGGVVALAARAAHLLPLAPRLALRDALRNRSRTAPAVAAVMAAIAGGVAITVLTAATDEKDRRDYVPFAVPGTARVALSQQLNLDAGPVPPDRQEQLDAVVRSVAAGARRALPGTSAVPMRTVANAPVSALPAPGAACPYPSPDALGYPDPTAQQIAAREKDPRCVVRRLPGQVGSDDRPLVDDGTALGVLTGSDVSAARAALAAGRIVVFDERLVWPDGRVHLNVSRDDSGRGQSTPAASPPDAFPATVVRLAHPYSGPVLPPSVAARAELPVTIEYVLLTTPATSQAARARVTADVVDVGLGRLEVEQGYHSNYTPGLIAATVAMVVIAFVGTVTAVGLALAEGRTEAIAFAAVGAGPGLRRRLAAAQAGVISVLGTSAGVAGGLLVGYVLTTLSADPATSGPAVGLATALARAWPYLAGLALGPLLMALAASFVFTRTALPLPRRVQ